MESWRTEKVETSAGVYTVDVYPDYDAEDPLRDDSAVAVRVEYSGYGGRWDVSLDTLKNAGAAGDVLATWLAEYDHDDDDVGRRYLKWQAITGDRRWMLGMGGRHASQSDYYRYAILVDTTEVMDAEKAIKAVMDAYQTYASGQVVGFVTSAPNGDMVESVWGYYDFEDAVLEGVAAAEYDAEKRVTAVNLAGAGIVGII